MSGFGTFGIAAGLIYFLFVLLYIALIGLGIYCVVLFIKLARRGIKALDIHLEEKGEKIGR